jgi:hypothetical protein
VSLAPEELGPCERCGTPLEHGDVRCAICGQASSQVRQAPARATAAVLRCEQCGAAVSYSAEAHGARCAFCTAVMRIEEPTDPIEAAEQVLPFTIDPSTAQATLRAWMKSLGFFRPSDLATRASVASLRPLFWAAWIFDATALVSWTADSNEGSRRSSWAPHAGQTPMTFRSVLVPASRGLIAQECGQLAPGFDLQTARSEPKGPPGAMLERFDVQRSAARAIIADAVLATAVASLSRGGVIPGNRYRKVKATVLLQRLVTRRVCLPTYVFAYRYKGTLYRALVHGQDAQRALGNAPYSLTKIVLVVLASLGAVGCAMAIVAYATSR